jgi:hypothetical protein
MTSIITSAYTAAATYPLNHARVGYQNWCQGLAASAVVVSSELPDMPKDGPLRSDTTDKWRAVSGASTWRVDLGQARAVNYVGLVIATSGVQITVAYSTDDTNWTTFATALTPTDTSPILVLDSVKTARYWRISVASPVTVAVVYIGQVLELERPFFDGHSPMQLSRMVERTSSMTRGGQFVGQDVIRRGTMTSVSVNNLTPTWYKNSFDPLVRHLETQPIFWAWNLLRDPAGVSYAWSADPIQPVLVAQTPGGRVSVSMSLRGLGDRI